MTDRRTAAQQVLDALGKWSSGRDMDAVELNDLIATLEAVLEQPELRNQCGEDLPCDKCKPKSREWRGLTEEDLEAKNELRLTRLQFARAIEAALKERNA